MHYYGSRTSRVEPSQDLGIKYFSSFCNKYFQVDQKQNPGRYKYKIVKIFNSRKLANEYEKRLHIKFNVKYNNSFINRGIQSSLNFSTQGTTHSRNKGEENPMYGTHRPEHSKNMTGDKNLFYNKKHSAQTLEILSAKRKNMVTCRNIITGERLSVSKEEFDNNENLVGSTFGHEVSAETKNKISSTTKGIKKGPFAKKKCPHCKRMIGINVISRFHMDNCKMRKL